MDRIIEQFMNLMRESMGMPGYITDYAGCDWNRMLRLSFMNKEAVLFDNVINDKADVYAIDQDTRQKWDELAYRDFFCTTLQLSAVADVLNQFNEKGITAIVLKGIVLSALYPEATMRPFNDLDIKLSPEDRDNVRQILEQMGFEIQKEQCKNNVDIYRSSSLMIEAHFTLWEDYGGHNVEVLRNEKLDAAPSLIRIEAFGCNIITLGVTQHLILQMFHIAKHFMVEGIEARYFLDITLFVQKYHNQIDFDYFWNVMKKLSFEDFTVIYFSECIKWFDMPQEALLNRRKAFPADENAFLKDIIFVGKQNPDDRINFNLLGILAPYVNGEKHVARSKKGRALQAIFPSVSEIGENYAYCWKHRWLLPAAWFHRIGHALVLKAFHRNEVYGAGEKIAAAEYRINMMQNAGLLK